MLNEKLVDEIMLDFRISEVSFDPQAVRRRFSLKFSESKKAGTEIELDGEKYIIMRQSDVLAII